MGILLKANGEVVKDIAPKNGTDFSLAELKEFIGGGYIELVSLDDFLMVVDEEGRLKDLPYNLNASTIAGTTICGDAFVCQKGEIK